jgi:hypothetical protein
MHPSTRRQLLASDGDNGVLTPAASDGGGHCPRAEVVASSEDEDWTGH